MRQGFIRYTEWWVSHCTKCCNQHFCRGWPLLWCELWHLTYIYLGNLDLHPFAKPRTGILKLYSLLKYKRNIWMYCTFCELHIIYWTDVESCNNLQWLLHLASFCSHSWLLVFHVHRKRNLANKTHILTWLLSGCGEF